MASMKYTFTSGSVCEGHPDKVCDFIADSILDAYLTQDQMCRVACEVLCKGDKVVLAGEITSTAKVDHEAIARTAIQEIGYIDGHEPFNANNVSFTQFIAQQTPEITAGVDPNKNRVQEQGAGDQGIMFGYATDETQEMMPLPILLAHRLSRCLAEDRKNDAVPWLSPDGKTQVSIQYEDGIPRTVTDVVVSLHHAAGIGQAEIGECVSRNLAPHALAEWFHPGIRYYVNPTGSFVSGGLSVDCGVTGRKIIVDTYGGAARHGGGAFSVRTHRKWTGAEPTSADSLPGRY
jgi:S-adenosylmethionine synthetase